MEGKRSRMLAGGGMAALALLIGATVWLKPAAAMPTVTVYKSPG